MELPDFNDLADAVEAIADLAHQATILEIEIKELEAKVFQRAMVEERWFQGGKPPSATLVENAYKFSGLEGEILPKRKELAEVEVALEREKSLFYLLKTRVEIWRSEQANQRASLSV